MKIFKQLSDLQYQTLPLDSMCWVMDAGQQPNSAGLFLVKDGTAPTGELLANGNKAVLQYLADASVVLGVQANSDRLDLVEAYNVANDADKVVIDATLISLAQQITNNDGDITALDARITSNDSDISTINSTLSSLSNQISSNDTDIANLVAKDTQHDASILANANAISTANQDIASNSTGISVNQTNLANLQQTVDDALSGGQLPTPPSGELKLVISEGVIEANRAQNRERYAASGFVHFGKQLSGGLYAKINDGLFVTSANSSYANLAILGTSFSSKQGESKLDYPKVNIAGFDCHLQNIGVNKNGDEWNYIHFPPAPDGTVTYDSATGTTVQHADAATAFASETTTNKVVTERVDLAFIEGFLEEVTASNPFVYPNGCIQAQAPTMDGIPTVNSTRPTSYFDQFVGQNGAVGKGVDFFAATDAEKSAMLSNTKNNLYYSNDGKLIQERARIRTVAGWTNGDWKHLNSEVNSLLSQDSSGGSLNVVVQGDRDTFESSGASYYYISNESAAIVNRRKGLFTARPSLGNNVAYNGECYALVIGTAQRLNQGAYHPSFNPLGASKVYSVGTTYTYSDWYNSDARTLANTAECFKAGSPTDPNSRIHDLYLGGSIGQASGRPDGRFYDAIYAGGQGGFRDYRYSAWDTSSAEYREQKLLDVYNGSYRGEEKLIFTKIALETATSTNGSTQYIHVADKTQYAIGDIVSLVDDSSNVLIAKEKIIGFGSGQEIQVTTAYARTSGMVYKVVHTYETTYPASGEFTCTEVIGDPANILLTDALKDGWLGYWNPTIPDGTSQDFRFSRKAGGSITQTYTENNGATWLTSTSWDTNFNTAENARLAFPMLASRIQVHSYTASAYLTKPAPNYPVLNGIQGLGVVIASTRHEEVNGSLLFESLLSKVMTESSDQRRMNNLAMAMINFENSTGTISTSINRPTSHTPFSWGAPSTAAVGAKALPYSVDIDSQVSINFAFNEVVYSTDWGDDSKIHTASQTTTGTDLNGQSRLIGTATLAIPLGWRKNDV